MNKIFPLRVNNVVAETADAVSLYLQPADADTSSFSYKSGQFITLHLEIDGVVLERCYSLSSAPNADPCLRVGVKRVQGGRVSNWINDNVRAGDHITAASPQGRFVLDKETRSSVPLVLIAAGSGITPVLSLMKDALLTTKRNVVLFYANQSEAQTMYASEIADLCRAHENRVRYARHFDDANGFVTADHLLAELPKDDIAEYYLCGPAPFMSLVENVLAARGVHDELVYVERFVSPTEVLKNAIDPNEVAAPESFSLWLGGRCRTVPYQTGKTLLQCAQDAGLQPPRSCESGYCGSCMAHVNTGNVVMRSHEALSDREVARGVALLCQSFPASNDPLELDSDSTSFRIASAVKSSYGKWASRSAAAAVTVFIIASTLFLRGLP
ncbi:MAG: ferredoxin--NADP reductase [Polyangiales bacterium]